MTSEEAINVLLGNVPKCCKMVNGRYQGGFDDWDCDMGQAIRVAVLALQDVRNYQKIGTVEEVMQNARDLKRQTEHSEHLAEVLKATQNLLEKRERLLKEYCKIATVEECQEAREKQKEMKPKEILRHRGGFEEYHCPNCNSNFLKDERYAIKEGYCSSCGKLLDSRFRNFCANCGQAIEKENLEGMEDE